MRNLLIAFIKLYRYIVSPLVPSSCRFIPSCSAFAIDAIAKYGCLKGSYLSVRRILRCHPFHHGGYDPVR
ncbi:MAG: membrane protein insertion efficiency factor YidD [Thermodesulfovibrionales bacterium]|nr:membrane protein insertion efficiency factor YidD [Thermodesulfovibrionales bacterium]